MSVEPDDEGLFVGRCNRSPHGLVKPGWYCSREEGHDGPCACWPVSHEADDTHRGPGQPDDNPGSCLSAGSVLLGVVLTVVVFLVLHLFVGA